MDKISCFPFGYECGSISQSELALFGFEFKLTENGTAEDALKQIDDKGYLIPYSAGNKKLVKIGAEFSTEERGLSRWVVSN